MIALRLRSRFFLTLILLTLTAGILACSEEPSQPRVWIDAPTDGASVSVGDSVSVIVHSFAREGIAEILLSVNGVPYRRSPSNSLGDSLTQSTQEWLPQQEGEYTLQVIGYTKNGSATAPARVRIQAIGKTTRTPTPTTPTPTPPTSAGTPDLAIVNVEAIVAGDKGGIPFCNTRVTYRNSGSVAIPRNFSIQFHFNGVPTLTNTVAGGLPPGANAEITFVYQFDGAPYIGINLDSTNVIVESNETNNAFAEIRSCGVAPASTITRTPTPTRTPTIGIAPPSCSGTPIISSFSASPTTIAQGQPATLSWGAVTNADSVYIDPSIGGVPAPGSASVSPNTTTTFTLTARCGNASVTRQVTVNVNPPISITPTRTPIRTPTPPPDTTAPPVPSPQVPADGTVLSCRSTQTLAWLPVTDPSGIAGYHVRLERQNKPGEWVSAGEWTDVDNKQITVNVNCGGIYRWYVRARDNAGNYSGWSGWSDFSVKLN